MNGMAVSGGKYASNMKHIFSVNFLNCLRDGFGPIVAQRPPSPQLPSHKVFKSSRVYIYGLYVYIYIWFIYVVDVWLMYVYYVILFHISVIYESCVHKSLRWDIKDRSQV